MVTGRRPAAETPPQQAMEVLSQDGVRLARAWQDGIAALLDGYGEQMRRFAELNAIFIQPDARVAGELQQAIGRIIETTQALNEAQAGVAREWLRAPLWPTGAASPIDLQAGYVRLFETHRDLASAYLDAALGWQRAIGAGGERAAETVREAVDEQTRTARRLANDAREVQQATIDATRSTASTVREVSNRAVTQR
jgi:methyl-accepting chemotaxis protein